MTPSPVSSADAALLAHALGIAVGRAGAVPCVVIKGHASDAHRVRARHPSADADVLVAPGDGSQYVERLARAGWEPRAAQPEGPSSEHSSTLVHPSWPCDIDVHTKFPGLLAPAEDVFDELWRRRQPLPLAGVEVDMIDRSSAILITALHALRTPVQTPRHAEEYRHLVASVLPALSASERADLLDLARTTGCVDTARPLLEHLGLELPPPVPHGVDPALDAWRARVGGHGEVLAKWMPVIGDLPWHKKPAAVARMVWPTEEQFRLLHPEAPDGRLAARRGRWARIGRGFRAVPTVIKGRMLARRGITDDSSLRQQAHERHR